MGYLIKNKLIYGVCGDITISKKYFKINNLDCTALMTCDSKLELVYVYIVTPFFEINPLENLEFVENLKSIDLKNRVKINNILETQINKIKKEVEKTKDLYSRTSDCYV